MARAINGILGAFVGKVGTVVGYVVNGESFMRSLSSRPKAMTEKEIINQAKFKIVQEYLKPIKGLVKVGFHKYYTKTGGFRGAVSYIRKEALVTDDAGSYIDPAKVKISGGDLEQAIDPVAVFEAPNQIKITWDATDVLYERQADQLLVLAYEMEGFKTKKVIFDGAYRKHGTMSLEIDGDFRGKNVDIYVGFLADDRSSQSNSQYLGRLEIPA